MTMEEAIQALKDLAEINVRHGCDDKWITALNMAIEALSAKPQTDLISRADAIKVFIDWGMKEFGFHDLNRNERFIDALSALPSADAVQGEWQKVEEQPYFRKHYDTVCCSVCRKKGNRKWKFCPNCGARMKGGAE